MANKRSETRQHLIQAALDLFVAQGVSETTTRQIAEQAGVNEVTLFRQFGHKHGLLLAAIEETGLLTRAAQEWVDRGREGEEPRGLAQVLRQYGSDRLLALEGMPELVRSLVGEAGQYSLAHRQVIGQEVNRANRLVGQYLETILEQGNYRAHLSAEAIAAMVHSALLGYVVLGATSEFHQLWHDRDAFVELLVQVLLHGAVEGGVGVEWENAASFKTANVEVADLEDRARLREAAVNRSEGMGSHMDLPAPLVHTILQRGRERGPQAFALVYVMFGAGLLPQEVALLGRSQVVGDRSQQLLHLPSPTRSNEATPRLVPVNQWIAGQRYGTYAKNPLTQWLKRRRDELEVVFSQESGELLGKALGETGVRSLWADCTQGLAQPLGGRIEPEQAAYTWRVEMLERGMTVANLSLLTGLEVADLGVYEQRAQVKRALEQALALDRAGAKRE